MRLASRQAFRFRPGLCQKLFLCDHRHLERDKVGESVARSLYSLVDLRPGARRVLQRLLVLRIELREVLERGVVDLDVDDRLDRHLRPSSPGAAFPSEMS